MRKKEIAKGEHMLSSCETSSQETLSESVLCVLCYRYVAREPISSQQLLKPFRRGAHECNPYLCCIGVNLRAEGLEMRGPISRQRLVWLLN